MLRPAVRDHKIKLVHGGDHPESPTFASLIGVDADAVTTIPRCGADKYPELLKFDVGMIPLRDTPFNVAKSDIKGLEYAASGIPFIAAALPEYARLWADWEGCFHLAKRPKDWISGINRYLDFNNRWHDQALLLDRVKTRDIQFGATRWIELLEGVV